MRAHFPGWNGSTWAASKRKCLRICNDATDPTTLQGAVGTHVFEALLEVGKEAAGNVAVDHAVIER